MTKIVPLASMPNEKLERTTVLIPPNDFYGFAKLAKCMEMTISELLKSKIEKFGLTEIRRFTFNRMDQINAVEASKISTFSIALEHKNRLEEIKIAINKKIETASPGSRKMPVQPSPPDAEPDVKRKLKKHKYTASDLIRYIVRNAVEKNFVLLETDEPEKIRISLYLPENDYRVVCAYAEKVGLPVNRLMSQQFPRFTDKDFSAHFVSADKGRKTAAKSYHNPDNDPRGPWSAEALSGFATKDVRSDLHFDLVNPGSGEVYPPGLKGWRYSEEKMLQLDGDGKIVWPSRKNGRPVRKKFLSEAPVELFRTNVNVYANMYPLLLDMANRLNVQVSDILKAFISFMADEIGRIPIYPIE